MTYLFQFITGTVIGSFITLSECRASRHESIIFPPSHCDNCHRFLKPWELIPVVSFLLLRGKCSGCQQPIGVVTWFGEIVGGIIVLTNPISLVGILEMIFEFALLLIALHDYRNYLIPTWILTNLFCLTLIINFIGSPVSPSLIFLTTGLYLIFLGLNHRYRWMGDGDIDLIFMIFLKTGLKFSLSIILLSSSLAIIKFLCFQRRHLIPYTPYLAISYLILKILP